MTEVARVAEVSLSTASHVLNGTRHVSADKRAAVLHAASELGYNVRRHDAAGAWTVGVVVPAATNPYFGEFIEGMNAKAVSLGADLLIMTSGEDTGLERRAVHSLISRRVDGIVLIPTGAHDRVRLPTVESGETPLVIADRQVEDSRFDQVSCESDVASEAIIRHLVALGHQRIGVIRGLADLSTTRDRESGHRRAHQRGGLAVHEELVVDGYSTVKGGREAMEQLLRLPQPPTAVYCTNNNMTVGALTTLRRRQVRIPADMAFVAFDDLEWSDLVEPGITSMAQPFHAMGDQAIRLLIDRIHEPMRTAQTVCLPPSLEHRGSCGCPEPP